jgi:hypothetical protein
MVLAIPFGLAITATAAATVRLLGPISLVFAPLSYAAGLALRARRVRAGGQAVACRCSIIGILPMASRRTGFGS